MKRLESKNIQKLSLEEALDLKVFIRVGAIDATMLPELNRHIELLYEKEAAPDQVEALHAAYRDSGKLWQEMEKLKGLIDTTMSDIVRAKSASFSFGEDKEVRYSFIKRAEEGFKMMVEGLEQKTKDFGLLEAEIKRLLPEIEGLKRKYLASHMRPVGNIPWEYKVRAWIIVKKALSAAAAAAAEAASGRRIIHSKSHGQRKSREQMETAADQRWAQTDGAEAMRWAENAQGVVLAPPPPKISKIPLSAYNTAEEKSLRELNRRESSNAAAAIFSNKSKKNKLKWGIPNLGTGFGGRRTRRRVGSRKRSER